VSLKRADRLLVLEAWLLLVTVWAGLRILPFSTVRLATSCMARLRTGPTDGPEPLVDRIAWAVTAVAERLPIASTCLLRALATDVMLRRRQFAAELHYGVVRRKSGSLEPLEGHAWVECGGRVVVGGLVNLLDYEVLKRPL
jgi:hypothetical protein